MIIALCIVGGLIVGILLGLEDRSRARKELVANLEREREEAKHEAKVYRNLLFPVMAKAEGDGTWAGITKAFVEHDVVKNPTTTASTLTPPNRRIPFRQRWKQAAQSMNSKQKKTDALASALTNQKSQEKINA